MSHPPKALADERDAMTFLAVVLGLCALGGGLFVWGLYSLVLNYLSP